MYAPPMSDISVTLWRMIEGHRLAATERYAEATEETAAAVLSEAGRLAAEAIAPVNRAGDLEGARLENGVVRTSPGFREAYAQIAEGGWVGMSASPDYGGMGLPLLFQSAANEAFSSACLALSLCPLLSQGTIEALEHHGSDALKALYLPKLISGAWNGAMNLTEPQAGTDLAALRARAERREDGTYAITGGKIWITWGDNDVAANTVHLVLARLPDAPPGVKGISLFLVPKLLPDESGAPGARNALQAVSLEHKMGIHGSPTCVMAFEGATGWLVGEENQGLACMFTMMNNARLGVGLQGVGIAEAATQMAVAFARERVQGRTPVQGGSGTIIEHADVRRMLLAMRALTQAARAVNYDCALHLDLAVAAATPEERAAAAAMGAFLTPIAKAFGTEIGNEVAYLGVQVHGGAGYVEETGAAQFARDVRITAIYEGTNGVQAMDLVGRKLSMDGGAAANAYLDRVAATAERLSDGRFADLGAALAGAVQTAREATDWMLAAEPNDRAAGGVAYLRLMGLTGGAEALVKAAAATGEASREALARFYVLALLPETASLAVAATIGAEPLYAASDAAFDG